MSRSTYARLRELLDVGAPLVEVLPEPEFADEHLPGAINLPLKRLDADKAKRGELELSLPVGMDRDEDSRVAASTGPEPVA